MSCNHHKELPEREKSRIARLVLSQINMEILLKIREWRIINNEIWRGNRIRMLLEKMIMNDFVLERGSIEDALHDSSLLPMSNSLLGRSFRALSAHSSFGIRDRLYHHHHHHSDPHYQFEVLPNGQVVRMRCPKCGADLFRSMLGFLNHCRIHCRLSFLSHEDRLNRCGVPASAEEAEHFLRQSRNPTLLKQRLDLALIRADMQGPLLNLASSSSELCDRKADWGPMDPAQKSRYYTRRSVIIGNEAKLSTRNGLENNRGGYVWRIYVKDPPSPIGKSQEPVSNLIQGVRFILHPSYQPDDVIDVTSCNEDGSFELTRAGWGEFPVRIQLYFKDADYCNPMELVHYLRMENASSSTRLMVMTENLHQIEVAYPQSSHQPIIAKPQESGKGLCFDDHELLALVVKSFPLVGNQQSWPAKQVGYAPVCKSYDSFLQLDPPRQLHLESTRSKAIESYLRLRYPHCSLDANKIQEWLRQQEPLLKKKAPIATQINNTPSPSELKRGDIFCRFCGIPHTPQSKFDILQKNCSLRPRKIHISSRTNINELRISNAELYPENSETVKRAKHDSTIPFQASQGEDTYHFCDDDDKILAWMGVELEKYVITCKIRQFDTVSTFLLGRVVKSFMENLLFLSSNEMSHKADGPNNDLSILTPLHVFSALTKNETLNFISNAFMSVTTPRDPAE